MVEYANGEKNGLSTAYYRNGNGANNPLPDMENGKQNGKFTSYYINGKVVESEGWSVLRQVSLKVYGATMMVNGQT